MISYDYHLSAVIADLYVPNIGAGLISLIGAVRIQNAQYITNIIFLHQTPNKAQRSIWTENCPQVE